MGRGKAIQHEKGESRTGASKVFNDVVPGEIEVNG
jgi:hypothetical protein